MKAQRCASNCPDRLSALPQPIIENILCLVPIEDAVRTSILSRSWRNTWTNIPKLAFHIGVDRKEYLSHPERFYLCGKKRKMGRHQSFSTIFQVLLRRYQGQPIDEFSLSMNDVNQNCVELDQIILHLSKSNNKTLEKFTLCLCENPDNSWYRLPSSFFCLNQLTHLSLRWCHLLTIDDHQFKGFGSLTTLYLENVSYTSRNTLLRFVSSCPLIKTFTMLDDGNCYIDDEADDANITKLSDCLHSMEHLCIDQSAIELFASEDGVPRKLPTAFVHLKSFCFEKTCFMDVFALPFVSLVLKSSPNLEKLRLLMMVEDKDEDEDEDPSSPDQIEREPINLQDLYSDIWLEHLKELEIEDFVIVEHELEFVKLILAKSPVLKKVAIFLKVGVTTDKENMVLRTLLCSSRASPHVKIFVGSRRPR